jgi:hypothetical protein
LLRSVLNPCDCSRSRSRSRSPSPAERGLPEGFAARPSAFATAPAAAARQSAFTLAPVAAPGVPAANPIAAAMAALAAKGMTGGLTGVQAMNPARARLQQKKKLLSAPPCPGILPRSFFGGQSVSYRFHIAIIWGPEAHFSDSVGPG